MNRFDANETVKTREGHRVLILKIDAPTAMPIIGMFISGPLAGKAANWAADGSYYMSKALDTSDLVPNKKLLDVTVYVNVNKTNYRVYTDKLIAETAANTSTLAIAVPASFTLEWGT